MDKMLCELIINPHKTFLKKVDKKFLGLFKYSTFVEEPVIYKYSIIFKIDEGRFYYHEEKPKNNEIQIKEIHTKNGCYKSILILKEIYDRVKEICPKYDAKFYNRFNDSKTLEPILELFSKFSKNEEYKVSNYKDYFYDVKL